MFSRRFEFQREPRCRHGEVSTYHTTLFDSEFGFERYNNNANIHEELVFDGNRDAIFLFISH